MAFVIDTVSEDTFYQNLFLGVTKILENNPRIKHVHLERQQACIPSDIVLWEQMQGLKLPEDLKEFYLATNGFKLSWHYAFCEQDTVSVGLIKIRTLTDLNVLTKCNLQTPSDLAPLKEKLYEHCNIDAKIVYLSNVDDVAKVCLVYGNNTRATPRIYLIENEKYCYYLTSNFKSYLLMAIAHLGLPMWQYCFTFQGVPAWAEQIFIFTAPHLITSEPVRKNFDEDTDEDPNTIFKYHTNKLDTNIFKIKHRHKHDDSSKHRKKH